MVNNTEHYMGVVALSAGSITINVSSTPQQAKLNIGEERKFDVLGNGYYELYVKINSISNNTANITVRQIFEKILPVVESNSNKSVDLSGQNSNEAISSQLCSDGVVRCTGGEIQKCFGGEWSVQEVCQYSCQEGALSCNNAPKQAPRAGMGGWALYALGIIILIVIIATLVVFRKKNNAESSFYFRR
jgi:hypothetical protein